MNEKLKIYEQLFKENLKKMKEKGLNQETIIEFENFCDKNIIDISKIEETLKCNEQILSFEETTWKNVVVSLIDNYGNQDITEMCEYLANSISSFFTEQLNLIRNNILSIVKNIENELTFKKNKTSETIADGLIMYALFSKDVKETYLDLVKTLYKAFIKYVLYYKDLNLNLDLQEHYKICYGFYSIKIDQSIDKLQRLIMQWIYNWNNTTKIFEDAIANYNKEDFNKIYAKKLTNEYF